MQQIREYHSNRRVWFGKTEPRPDPHLEDQRIRQMMVDHEYWAPRIGWTMVGLNVLLGIAIIWFTFYWVMQGIQWVTSFF
jgi:hypothetical protein